MPGIGAVLGAEAQYLQALCGVRGFLGLSPDKAPEKALLNRSFGCPSKQHKQGYPQKNKYIYIYVYVHVYIYIYTYKPAMVKTRGYT